MVFRTLKNSSRSASGGLWGRPGPRGGPGSAQEAPPEGLLGEKWPGNSSWALLEVTKILFWSPGGSPRALGERFLDALNVLLRALGFQDVFRTILASKKVPREASGTLKIKVFV